jgi:hypothetical protein
MPKCSKCGGARAAVIIDYPVYVSEAQFTPLTPKVRVVASSGVIIKTAVGNYRIPAGANKMLPPQIADDLIAQGAPLWLA